MKRKNVTRNALFTSVLALLLCVSMLVGTTFAWFTDTVESGRNLITAGNLDIKLFTDAGEVNKGSKLFKNINDDLWEPGVVAYENFTVRNAGNLALKYNMNLTVLEETTTTVDGVTYKLGDAIKVGVVDGAVSGDRSAVVGAVTSWTTLSDFQLGKNDVKMEAGAADHNFAIVLYWQPDVDYTDGNFDNYFNLNNDRSEETALKLEIGVNLYATQMQAESDSFDETYDKNAKYSNSETVTVSSDGSVAMTAGETTVEAPAGAFNEGDEAKIEVKTTNTLYNVVTDDGQTVASVDVVLTVNGQAAEALTDGKVYTVTTYISKGLTNVQVYYEGTLHPSTYESETGKLVFTTNHFSEYVVKADKAVAYNVADDTAYKTAGDVVTAIQGDAEITDVTIADSAKQNVLEAAKDANLSTKDMNALEDGLAAAKRSGSSKTYLTLEAAMAEANANETITLLSDVYVDAMIVNNKVITLDLNGKTINGTDTTTKNFSLIDNRGTLTITGNGKMTLTATVNSGWNRYSAVLANNPGGKLVIENGIIEHLGGTDMAYGIDNLTNGDGTYAETIINGGTVKSTYRGIRQFLNGNNADNILTVNGGTIEGANKSIWMQAPTNKKPCSGTLTVSENAVLKGDVYLFVTEGSTEWPVTVSIAASAVNGEVISGNVPYGYLVVKENGEWTVLEKAVVVSTMIELADALNAGMKIIDAQGANLGDFNYDAKFTGGAVIKNAKFTYFYGGNVEGTVTFENCEFVSDHSYSANFDSGNGNIIFNNCLFDGWSSFGTAITNVEMNNCNFQKTYKYGMLRFYQTAQLNNCTFSGNFEGVDTNVTGCKVEFTNCTGIDGKIYNNGSNTGIWVVNGTDISDTVTSW